MLTANSPNLCDLDMQTPFVKKERKIKEDLTTASLENI